MGRPTIFLCVICLFYLVNSSLSRVLDQSEERKKLCEEAGIVNRSCTAEENILIKKTIVALQEAENERVEKVQFKNDAQIAIGNVSRLEEQKDHAYDKALQTFVVPYLCQKADIYLDLWGTVLSQTTTTTTSAPINSPYSPQMPPPGGHDLDSQTRSNYRNNAKKIYGILKNSNDPRVLAFVAKVKSIHPAFTEENIADNFGLAIALLNNYCKHGVLANDPELSKLINPDTLVEALRKWSAPKDVVLLDVVKCFEEVTT